MRAALLAAFGLVGACAAPASVVAPVHNSVPVVVDTCAPPPADWHPDEMARATRGGRADKVRILAWQQTIDDRPLRIDSVLIWIKAGSAYGLAHLYRHPDDGPHAPWEVAMIYDAEGFTGQDSYDAPPTHAQLEQLIGASNWNFGAEPDFRLVASGLCADAWVQSFGEPPWHAYPKK